MQEKEVGARNKGTSKREM